MRWTTVALATLLLGGTAAAETGVSLNLESRATSNVFLDAYPEWDLIVHPSAEAAFDFGNVWSAGYGGEVNVFTQHTDLFSHWHEAYLFANPAWGKERGNEYTFELRAEWLANRESYATLDLLQPSMLNKLELEIAPWLRWRAALEVGYRLFYNDRRSSSIDVLGETSLAISLPSRTTFTPRVRYGLRRYRGPPQADGSQATDAQTTLGLKVGQALWRDAGLQLEGSWSPLIGSSTLIERLQNEQLFVYLGEDFIFSGLRGKATFKQYVGERWMLEGSLLYEKRDYAGWLAQVDGIQTGEMRRDVRLVPRVVARYAWKKGDRDAEGGIERSGLSFDYMFLRQQSNHTDYDTSAQIAVISVWGDW